MKMLIKEIFDKRQKEKIASEVLDELPQWFSIEEAKAEYIKSSADMPFFASFDSNGNLQGFIVLKCISEHAAEIFVMGVKKIFQHKGVGTTLYKAFEDKAKGLNCNFVEVKTVEKGRYKEYDATNDFYISLGFKELEVLPELWDKQNPCQVYIKYIGE